MLLCSKFETSSPFFLAFFLFRPTDRKLGNASDSKQIKVNGLRGSTFKQHTTDQPRSYLVGFALTVTIRYSNGQRKTHQIAQIRHVEPQKRQYTTNEGGLHLF